MTDTADNERIEGALRRLPRWTPPPDFAALLASAAARQQGASAARVTPSRAGRLLAFLDATLLPGLVAGLGGAVLATVPWNALPVDPVTVAAVTCTALLAVGIPLTLRVLRS